MTFQYYLFDKYLGVFIMTLPLAIIISAFYGLNKYEI